MMIPPFVKTIIKYYAWYGVVAILVGYALISLQIIPPTHLAYKLLNVTGALGIALEAFVYRDYQPMVLNVVFAIIAFLALLGVSFAH